MELEKEDLYGFIFKARSPSSGMAAVKVYNDTGNVAGKAPGVCAKAFMAHFPSVPCIEYRREAHPDECGSVPSHGVVHLNPVPLRVLS